jgi:hypothetical protein
VERVPSVNLALHNRDNHNVLSICKGAPCTRLVMRALQRSAANGDTNVEPAKARAIDWMTSTLAEVADEKYEQVRALFARPALLPDDNDDGNGNGNSNDAGGTAIDHTQPFDYEPIFTLRDIAQQPAHYKFLRRCVVWMQLRTVRMLLEEVAEPQQQQSVGDSTANQKPSAAAGVNEYGNSLVYDVCCAHTVVRQRVHANRLRTAKLLKQKQKKKASSTSTSSNETKDQKEDVEATEASEVVQMLDLLIKHKADPHACGMEGWSPLHVAALNNQSEPVIRALLRRGLDINGRNQESINVQHSSWSPAQCAASRGHVDMLRLLQTT